LQCKQFTYNLLSIPSTLASERPAAPGQSRYIHRATGTGAVSYWDGSAWRAVRDAVTNATQLQGRGVASTAPTTGQALVWNGSLWVPGTASGATVYQRSADATDGAEVRADGVYATPLPSPLPNGWTLLASP